ncbi:low affinity immunoglobulin epsilon Fc receptor-like [Oryzias latipes]|uniref:low affinity immunoglobulin epsilon Fc receptor-like n=1 Tax=Oryzias latipes TaxID=8090 RepID=UPI0009D91E16|nr:low affinity immunoglobulin epsilon Fc receptor-like [Oryzias latipes]
MEEEIQYSSVVFKGRAAPPRNNREEVSVYSSIKNKKPLTSETEVQASGIRHHPLLCLGIICFLLCAIIITVIIYFAMETKKLKLNLSDLEAKNEQLTLEKRDLQNQTEDLKMNMTKLQNQNEQLRNNSDKLNKILAAIISYTNFPADLFCPDGVCQTCPKDWIQFQESCYFFNHFISPLKQWDQSRQLCQSMKSDLVVISSLEEQNFIKNKIQYYYDTHHGYWIGLRKVNNKWIWVDGSPDTLGYWKNPGSSEDFAIIAKDPALTQSWIQNINGFLNRFICEIKALIF